MTFLQSATPLQMLAIAAAVLVSAVLRGFSGFGFALVATPLLSVILPPALAVGCVILLQLSSGLLDVRRSLTECDPRSTALLAAGAVVTAPFGVLILKGLSPDVARLAIAAVTILATVVLASGWSRKSHGSVGYTVAFGLTAGVFGGASAMPGPPVIAYYMSVPVEPRTARASMNVIFVATGLSSLISGLISGLIGMQAMLLFAVTCPLMILGTRAGGRLFHIAPPRLYRPVGMAALAVSAMLAVARALT